MKKMLSIPFACLFLLFAAVSEVFGHSKPTVVLVPGAWHSPIHYSLVTGLLSLGGYPIVSERLPSVNSTTPKSISVTTDADFVRNELIVPLLNQGKDVLLIAHSYGGSPGAAAAYGLSKAERTAAGETGGVIGLIFIAAFLAETGVSVLDDLGGQFNSWVVVNVSVLFIDLFCLFVCLFVCFFFSPLCWEDE
jgi:pimeloyl-ACP methyl ester carboxylesterase